MDTIKQNKILLISVLILIIVSIMGLYIKVRSSEDMMLQHIDKSENILLSLHSKMDAVVLQHRLDDKEMKLRELKMKYDLVDGKFDDRIETLPTTCAEEIKKLQEDINNLTKTLEKIQLMSPN